MRLTTFGITAVLALSSSLALANYNPVYDPNDEAMPSVEDDFMEQPYKKVGKYKVSHCFAAQGGYVDTGAYVPDDEFDNFCNLEVVGKAFEKASKQKANFNKNYVLYQYEDKLPNESTMFTWFALNKKTNEVVVLGADASPRDYTIPGSDKLRPKTSFNAKSNQFCITPQKNLGLYNTGDDFEYEGKTCFYLKKGKYGPFWSELK
ncbi:hypothetical protein NKT77_06550 [Moraxella sp. FZLJ2107]|uniref:hypothetical protein n=1 Tax=unclassified Moraxella TaxID=2685852 RepID=UPI00209BD31E|nr:MULTISPECIES: hypothetical protein [unclassified Moraxella]USZ14051.1 hypothetical protein NGM44_06505 [Moraxella sp. FZFQ2102]UTO04195.1 hypothetical protein NKT77_06550 [Moraxella sp. FZLJ2107]UTO23028.1 hypothetical protein NKU06_03335 [Moraxella sp. FZLJ2109]